MELNVAVIGPAHALRGAVRLDVRTDAPEERLVPGTVFETDPPEHGPLTLVDVRRSGTAVLASFAGIDDRSAAEALRGTALIVDSEDLPAEDDAWYPHELVGLGVVDHDGAGLGTVAAVEHLPAHDVLVVTDAHDRRVWVPFVSAIVTHVDVAGGTVRIEPPDGLFDGPPDELSVDTAEPGAAGGEDPSAPAPEA